MTDGRPIAAIDIGTSSVHLAIAQATPGGRPEILLREKLPVRLGSGATDMKTLDPAAIDRTIEALARFRALADAHGADVHAVATSAVREAEDPSMFLDRARDEAGVDVEVIAGVEEARLIHLGVLGAVPISNATHLVIDVGGGSTELIVGHETTPLLTRSVKVGHVRLTNRFFPDGIIDTESIAHCRRFIRSFLARDAMSVREHAVEVVACASGTFETIARVARRNHDGADRRQAIRRDEVDEAVSTILAATTPAERLTIPGVEAHRGDTIAAGAILVQTLMDSLDFREWILSPDALREGLVLDRLNRVDPSPDTLLHLSAIRSSSVQAVAERFGENTTHARQATDIALQLFDATAVVHEFADYERDILEAASMTHNIGRFVAHGAHHRHSYYVIRNTDQLAGFNEHERELIAQVARYHRKSEPKPTHAEFQQLSDHDQHIVVLLAGTLRLGIALDRTYRNLATELSITLTDSSLEIVVKGDADELELELFAANERRQLLERAIGREVTVRAEREREPV